MKKIVMFLLTVLFSSQLYADYRGELGIDYTSGSVGVGSSYSVPDYTPPTGPTDPGAPPIEPPPPEFYEGGDDDFSGWTVSGQYFLEPVDTSQGPLQLAEFLSRASSVGGRYGQLETDDTDIETDMWQVFTRLIVGESLVVEASYGQSDIDTTLGSVDVDMYTVAGGYYVAETTQVRLGYDVEEQQLYDFERWLIDITHVQQMENGMSWQAHALIATVTGDADFGRDDDGSDLELAFKWFFNHNFGIGADYQMSDRDVTGDTDAYQLWASYFPTDKISVTLSYYDEENDEFDVDSDGVVFEAKYRF
ncbi:MAG: putative porin [Pseudomonadaceae bacterium]|nr:putative porin [Pseudomonadaceae bacterium]